MTIRMAVPNKGRLNERAVELLAKSGIELGEDWGRRLRVAAEGQGLEILFVRAQDIPAFVSSGAIDFGITGEDMVAESGRGLEKVMDMGFGHCRLSLAAPEDSGIASLADVPDGARIATSFPRVTEGFLRAAGKRAEIIEVSGAAEIMPYLGVSDLISDLVATGSTLKTNRLAEVCKIMDSQAAMFASREALARKGAEIADVADSIRSVMAAEDKKYLMADVPADRLGDVQRILPGIGGPTVLRIAGNDGMVAVHAVVASRDMYRAVNDLKKIGARGILSVSIDRLVE
ncbi:MAG: ATP phosphoribosyltransferase [Candidatus Methanoplasma sp.]|nr:ATP phosphoribosyltransferase [Candidatus Methanoplasma sp.]